MVEPWRAGAGACFGALALAGHSGGWLGDGVDVVCAGCTPVTGGAGEP